MPSNRDWLAERPFTLVLSAGFFGFFAHTGVLTALERAGLRPQRVVGISAGALAGGLWAAGLDAAELTEELVRLRRADFWDPGLPFGGLLKGDKFAGKLAELVGGRTFAECRTPFATVVHDLVRRRPEVVERGPLAPAIQASCTVPLMFRPRLVGRAIWVDGGVSDRYGRVALGAGERALIHALPSKSARSRIVPSEAPPTSGGARRVLVIPELPRVGPFHLSQGQVALARAYERVRCWLGET